MNAKLYELEILISQYYIDTKRAVRIPMTKTVFNNFVYVYNTNSWQPASNPQSARMTKL